MGILASPMSYLLTWIYDFIGNYGLALLVFTILIKGVMYPLYAKQIKTTMNMSKMQPKIKEIQQKYAKDKALMNQKMAELYKEEGGSMYGGCLPMLIQMIVIMGLFALLRNPMNYISSDKMLFAIHESFLWIPDLAQPDKWVLPIIAGIATFLATYFSQTNQMSGPVSYTHLDVYKRQRPLLSGLLLILLYCLLSFRLSYKPRRKSQDFRRCLCPCFRLS